MLTSLFLLHGLALAQESNDNNTENDTETEETTTEDGATKPAEEIKETATETEPVTKPPKDEDTTPVDTTTTPAQIILINGNQVNGKIPEDLTSDNDINIEIGDGVFIPLPSDAIQQVNYTFSKFQHPDHASRRYFFSSSAMPLPVGTGQIAQTQLIATTGKFSPLENLTLSVGTSIPFLLYTILDTSNFLATTGIQYSTAITPNWFLGVGYDTLFVGNASISMPYVTTTVGKETTHFTLRVGGGFETFEYLSYLPIQFSFYHRFSNRIAFITENWFIPVPYITPEYDYNAPLYEGPCFEEYEQCYEATYSYDWQYADTFIVQMTGVRVISHRFTTDLGILFISDGYDAIPLPWVDVAWKIGK